MTRGKVVLVPFPFDDLSTTKVRPAVCLTDPVGVHRHIILAFITSRVPDELLETDIVLDPARAEHAATGLRVRSVLRLHRMMTVSTSLLQRELGELSTDAQAEVDGKIRYLFALEDPASGSSP
ncbi:MAG TPA: type II toxin-antitoxin system PemK/MazF family toxin [Rubrobacteraceae bacterium]|nr:type II toxin-antitoxin system PemK/MazF family toxin [Rubrobacteraceae bacterium]